MLRKNNSLLMAEAVLSLLNMLFNDESKEIADLFIVENLCNRREQGYLLKGHNSDFTLNIAFAKDRSSDALVVYTFDKTTNLPVDDKWDRTFFENNYLEAAEHIFDLMVNFSEKNYS